MEDLDENETRLLAERLVKQDIISQEEMEQVQGQAQESGNSWLRQLILANKITFSTIDEILRYEFHPPSRRKEHKDLGRALVELGAITEAQLDDALALQKRNGRLLGNVLLDLGLVTRRQIARALATQAELPFVAEEDSISDAEALEAVPEPMALKYEALPQKLVDDHLTLLITDPRKVSTAREIGMLLKLRVDIVLTDIESIKEEIRLRYAELSDSPAEPTQAPQASESPASRRGKPAQSAERVKEDKSTMAMDPVATQPESPEEGRFDRIARDATGAPVIKLVNTILEGAINSGATDVHLDPQEPEMRVRYRIDGILHDIMSIPARSIQAVVSRVKIMADMDITETRRPQDGHFGYDFSDLEYDVRVATMPCFLGERVVLRMLDQTSVLQGVSDLGLEDDDRKVLEQAINQPYGMVLVTGPTGSGKTTTLYACLNQKNVMTDSIVTLEDPVEYQLPGINQVQIDPDIDVTFANTLRAALRQDIDVLLVGEVRDMETARIAVRAAMTGHLVFTTLHTNDAPEAINTLINMNVPPFLLSNALSTIIAQRLVRKICDACKQRFTPSKTLLKSVGLPQTTKSLWRGKGCEQCYHTGNHGRTGIFEILSITPAVRQMIADGESTNEIAKAAKLKTMADRCRLKVKHGLVNPEEFLRVIRT